MPTLFIPPAAIPIYHFSREVLDDRDFEVRSFSGRFPLFRLTPLGPQRSLSTSRETVSKHFSMTLFCCTLTPKRAWKGCREEGDSKIRQLRPIPRSTNSTVFQAKNNKTRKLVFFLSLSVSLVLPSLFAPPKPRQVFGRVLDEIVA